MPAFLPAQPNAARAAHGNSPRGFSSGLKRHPATSPPEQQPLFARASLRIDICPAIVCNLRAPVKSLAMPGVGGAGKLAGGYGVLENTGDTLSAMNGRSQEETGHKWLPRLSGEHGCGAALTGFYARCRLCPGLSRPRLPPVISQTPSREKSAPVHDTCHYAGCSIRPTLTPCSDAHPGNGRL